MLTSPNNCAELDKLRREAMRKADPVFFGALTPDEILDIAQAIREEDAAAGVVSVPVEPTPEMDVAGTEEWLCIEAQEDRSAVNYRAMLAASPFVVKS